MNATMDDLLIIIGRQAVQIALLEAKIALSEEAPVEHVALTQEDKDAIKRAFN